MLRVIALLTMIISTVALKNNVWATMESVEAKSVNADGETTDVQGRNESSSDGSFDGPKASLSMSVIKAKPSTPISHDLDGKLDANQHQANQNQATAAVSRLARSQQWSDSQRAPAESSGSGSGLFWVLFFLLVAGGGVAGVSVLQGKGAKQQDKAEPLAMSVSLGVKPRASPAPLPNGLTEVDVLETFDSYDKARRGFIDREVLEGLLGPDEDRSLKIIGQVDKLFYHDFRKLVLQPGPVQNAVANAASRKRGSPIELGSLTQ